MVDFGRAREFMVDNQVRTSGVTDWRVLAQMSTVPREVFVPAERRELAYIDAPHRLGQPGSGRFMPPPALLAKLIQLAEITDDDSVLDIGAGTGYATAVIAGLAASVVGLESDAALAAAANANLEQLAIANASVVAGDSAALGKAQFDVILVQGTLEAIPPQFLALLADGGRMVVVLRQSGMSVANVLVRAGKDVTARAEFDAVLPPLFAGRRDEEFVF